MRRIGENHEIVICDRIVAIVRAAPPRRRYARARGDAAAEQEAPALGQGAGRRGQPGHQPQSSIVVLNN